MRIVGKRPQRPISETARADLLIEGARFNDEIHRLPGGQLTCMPKGIYRFNDHQTANRQQEDCIVAAMVEIARKRQCSQP